jgi:hypothetical protein
MRPGQNMNLSAFGIAAAILLLMLPNVASAEKRVKIDETVIPRALIWIDGIPSFPPYKIEIVGDTALVINGRPVKSFPLVPSSEKRVRAPADELSFRAFGAMRAALAAGLRDSAVAAAGCAVFNSDTSLAGVATIDDSLGREVLLTRKDHSGKVYSYDHVLVPGPRDLRAPEREETVLDRLNETYRATESILAHGSAQFFCHNGSCTMTVPRSFFPRLMRDIRAAALADSVSIRDWYRPAATPPRLLDPRIADLIARNTIWEGQ